MTTTIDAAQAAAPDLSRGRLYAMRVGYSLIGVGRAKSNGPISQTPTRCRSTKASPGACCSHRQPRSRAGGTVAWQPAPGHLTPSRHFDRGEQPSGWRR